MTTRRLVFTPMLLVVCFAAISRHTVSAETLPPQQPLWEFRLGLAAADVPHYRGSPDRELFWAPIPNFIYRGERITAGDEGVQGFFIEERNIKLDVSLAGGLPAPTEGETLRRGMPRLEPTFEVGPQLQLRLWASERGNQDVWLRLPARATFSFDDLSAGHEGFVLAPSLRWKRREGRWEQSASFGPMYADKDYHDYYYGVSGEYATPLRPAYDADGGYSGTRFSVSFQYRASKLWFGIFARYDWLNNAAFYDSPLRKRDEYVVIGFGSTFQVLKSSKPAAVIR